MRANASAASRGRPAPRLKSSKAVKGAARRLAYVSPESLKGDPRNPRKHSKAQIEALSRSIKSFGFNARSW